MSAAAGNEGFAQLQADKVLQNSFWLGTLFWRFRPDFDKLNPGECFGSESQRILTFEQAPFYLIGWKSSPISISISLCRVVQGLAEISDLEYLLYIHFTLLGTRQPPVIRVLDPRKNAATVSYVLNPTKPEKIGTWTVKCVIELKESIRGENNETFKEHNYMLNRMLEQWCLTKEAVEDLAKLLNRENLNEIFSGRQDKVFVIRKSTLLKRSLPYASEIRKKQSKDIKPNTLLDAYLGYIAGDHFIGIGFKECVRLFLQTHHYGLDFLRSECLEFMKKGLSIEFRIDVIAVMDLVNDKRLKEVLDIFQMDAKVVSRSIRWKRLYEDYPLLAESILYAVELHKEQNMFNVPLHALDTPYTLNDLSWKPLASEKRTGEMAVGLTSGLADHCVPGSNTGLERGASKVAWLVNTIGSESTVNCMAWPN